ncbi:TRAP transporter small permease [Cytobacillus firmus]|uniref:TRAP transporter small permease n=1 Tax=Cytobacillus firmus TaxID=1399 RepID=UPI0021626A4F|nr:TRAP transporter small permease [Cytobacillus firmus]
MVKVKRALNQLLSIAVAVLLAFMTLLTIYQVIMRYFLKNPSTISEDLLSYSFVWVSLLGTALVFGQRGHMNMSFLPDKLKGTPKLTLEILSEVLIMIIVALVFLFGGSEFMEVGMMQLSPTLNISMNWVYIILPLSGILIIIYNIINLYETIRKYSLEGKENYQ